MKPFQDPELDDVLQDKELQRIASVLSSAQVPEPPLDDAFQTGLRRQLMTEAWDMAEGRRDSLWRRAFAPPGMAWAGAAAGLILIASVVLYATTQGPTGLTRVEVVSPMDGSKTVALQQPILVAFNQPMDHASTEAAVQITPATNVTFTWQGNNKLEVQPTSGNLAPNTQYQVTVGPGAKTASGQQLAAPQMFTFVTQPPPAPPPTPSPTPRPTPTPPEKPLASLGAAGTVPVTWSADSSSVYIVDANGALKVVPAKGGEAAVVVPDGVSVMAMAPAGDRLAYVRAGKIEVLAFASGKTSELVVTPAPVLVGWAKDKLLWTAADAVYSQGANGPTQLASLPTTGTVSVLSIAPDGGHVAYLQDQKLHILDVSGAKTTALGQTGARFLGWSPGGSYLMYSSTDAIVVADMQGNSTGTLASGGDPSWSSQDAILLGSDTDLYEVRPDGSAQTKVANGTFHSPLWAPNGSTFIYFRGNGIYVATAPPLPPPPTALDQASPVVTKFMDARLRGLADQAASFLDDNGKAAYKGAGMSLTISGDPQFTRYYVLTQETISAQPDTTRFVVRLVLSYGKIDVSDFEETLALVRDSTTKLFLIDQAIAGSRRDLGKGASVVSVNITADTVKVTFDSDLNPGTVQDGVFIMDAKGEKIDEGNVSYADRVVTLNGLDLKPGGKYKLVVLTSVRDVQGRNVATEYDLDILGPAPKKSLNQRQLPPSALPSPNPGD